MQSIWFHPKGSRCGKKAAGRIETRLEYVRIERGIINKKSQKSQAVNDNDNFTSQMRSLDATVETVEIIKDLLKKTLSDRNTLRKRQASANEMLTEFPKLKEYNGEMLSYEYDLLFPKQEEVNQINMDTVLKYENFFDNIIEDENLRCVVIILFHLKKSMINDPQFYKKKENEVANMVETILKPIVTWFEVHE